MKYSRPFLSFIIVFASVFSIIPQSFAKQALYLEALKNRIYDQETLQFSAFIQESEGVSRNVTFPEITWHSTFPSVASINSDGLLTGHKRGNTQVYARFGGTNGSSPGDSSNVRWVTILPSSPTGEGAPRILPTLSPELGEDADGDGLSDSVEATIGSNPKNKDTDSDGIADLQEVLAGTSPRNRGALFPDIDDVDWAREHIIKLTQFGIIKGFQDGKFRPKASITRAELLKLILEATGVQVDTFVAQDMPFSDISPDNWQYQYVAYSQHQGIIKGYDDGKFRPNQPVNRREAVKIILEAIGVGQGANDLSSFWDVKVSWAIPYIERAFELGLINGYPDGSFKPDLNISRAEASKIISGLL